MDFLLSLLYPDRCVVCDTIVDYNTGVCEKCKGVFTLIDSNRCFKCGKQLRNDQDEYCHDCEGKHHNFDRGYPLYVYDDNIRKSIYRFKYSNRQKYARYYGKEMTKGLGEIIKKINPDAIIPVPLHKKRLKKRGYNQSYLIAVELGKRLNIPVYENYVVRVKNTTPLKQLNANERQNNLKKAFKIGDYDVKLNSIVIVDDIYTTGSTIDEMSAVLRIAGVKEITFVALSSGSND